MDQNAFRSLLSAPRSAGESSKRVLGAPAPKRAWAAKSKSNKEYEKKAETKDDGPILAPRTHQKKMAEGKYKDRAEMRRQGADDEYKPVEKLLEDLEQRARDAGDDARELDKARQYLGGDAEHSILVKGLDYSLLAARKAELARAKEEVADETLDALLGGEKLKPPEVAKPKQEEAVGKGFRSISQKDGEKPKKKKKKKVKAEPAEGSASAPVAIAPQPEVQAAKANVQADVNEVMPLVEAKAESEPDVDDIFGDAGEYDLTAGWVDDDSSDGSDVEAGQLSKGASPPRRSRSRSVDSRRPHRRRRSSSPDERRDRSRWDNGRDRRRERSDSEDQYGSRRDRSRDRYGRSDSRDRYERHRSDSRERYHPDRNERYPRYRDESPNRHYGDRYRDRGRDDQRRRRRSPSPRQSKQYSRSPRRSDSRSPKRRRYSPSPSPPRKAPARRSRSPSPMFDPYAIQSRSPSPSSDEGRPFTGKLQPLASSAIADVKGFLSADASAAKAEEKRAKKAAWRARQGLGPQEGTEDLAKKDMNEKQKFNRDYVVLMNKMKKDEEGKGPA